MKGFERRQIKKSYSSPPSSHFFHLFICLPNVCLVSCVVLIALVLSVCSFDKSGWGMLSMMALSSLCKWGGSVFFFQPCFFCLALELFSILDLAS